MSDASRELGSITLAAELANLEVLQEHLAAYATTFGLAPKRIGMLTMAFEEIFVNICNYAYPAAPGTVTLTCHDDDAQFVAEVIDQGEAFDVASIGDPDLAADVDTRKIGGLGWFLIRKIADELHCFRRDGQNIVRLTMNR